MGSSVSKFWNPERHGGPDFSPRAKRWGPGDGLRHPQATGLIIIILVTGLLFWVFWRVTVLYFWNVNVQAIMKFLIYVDVLIWMNSAMMLRGIARGEDTDSMEFFKDQVRLSLTFILVLVLSEIPLLLSVI